MEFIPYKDLWYWCKHLNITGAFNGRDDMYETQAAVAEAKDDPFTFRQVGLEQQWLADNRPYYQVFPAVLPMLLKVPLDLPCTSLKLPRFKALELRLPKMGMDCPFSWTDDVGQRQRVENVLFGIQDIPKENGSDELIPGIILCFDIGEREPALGAPIYSFRFFPLREDMTMEDASNVPDHHWTWRKGIVVPESVMTNLLKLAACVMLLDNDPELVTPDVLSKDAARWLHATEAERETMVGNAWRRGKVGWNIGAAIEVMPHLRRPHPALVWTGQGRTTPKIVLRKGSIVHRSKLTAVPTGFSESPEN
jgi:hypothetical protein